MIVRWTIKGNDVFPRVPQGRIISAEFAPQNNLYHTECKITPSIQHHHKPYVLLQQRLVIFIDLTWHFLTLHYQHLCTKLTSPQNFIVIPSKDYYLIPFVTLPHRISTPISHPLDTTASLESTSPCTWL